MKTKRFIAGLMGVTLIASFVGCTPRSVVKSQIDKDSVQVEVVAESNDDKRTEVISDVLEVESISQYEGIRVSDWLDNNIIIATKGNKNHEPFEMESGDYYPHNLYTFNLDTGVDELLIDSKYHIGNGTFSKDRKHIFYVEYIEGYGTGFIADADGSNKMQVTGVEEIFQYDGKWIDNENVIFSGDTGIELANVEGKTNEIFIVDGDKFISNPVMIDNNLCYLDSWNMIYNDPGLKELRLISEDIQSMDVSLDGKHIVALRNLGEEKQLVIFDKDVNEETKFTHKGRVFGVSWSPDSSYIAYSVSEGEEVDNGLYIANISTNEVIKISSELHDISDKLRWSKNGKHIAVPTFDYSTGKEITHIITFK